MEGLNTYEIPREPAEQTETSAVGTLFGRFFGHFNSHPIFAPYMAQALCFYIKTSLRELV